MTAPGIGARKAAELNGKLASVRDELARWRDESAATGPLRLHQSQIVRITRIVDSLADRIANRIGELAGDEQRLLSRTVDVEVMVLELHRIWEFFRAKLALRYIEWFAPHLATADELAWSWYEPARARMPPELVPEGGLREPPLTFFNGGSTPWTVPRGSAFAAEDVPGEVLRTPQFAAALRRLPIPVVGLPWHQVEHLPDALVIAHETGHLVEEDLGLGPALRTAVDGALRHADTPDAHREAWSVWAREAIADVFGAHAAGPAFGGALLDFLAADRWSLSNEVQVAPDWSPYPTRSLRIALAAEALRHGGLHADADALQARWDQLADAGAMPGFGDDVPLVVDAILQTPHPQLGGAALGEVAGFGLEDQAAADATATRALTARALTAADPRILVAGARLAFERDPVAYRELQVGRKVRARIVQMIPEGVRDLPADALAAADAATGAALADLITAAQEERCASVATTTRSSSTSSTSTG